MSIRSMFVGRSAMMPWSINRPVRLKHDVVDVAPAPVFPWLKGHDDRMLGRVKVLGGVPVPGTVATADVTALHAESEMDPGIACLQTIFTAVRTCVYLVNMASVCTGCCHLCSIPYSASGSGGRRRYPASTITVIYNTAQ